MTCPICGDPLAITGPGFDRSPDIAAAEFIGLPFAVSANAVWTCATHGMVDRVRVAVVEGLVSYVEATREP